MATEAALPPIVLIHGLWLTRLSWEGWKERFEGRGYDVMAPAWPRMDAEVEKIRRDPSPLNGLGISDIADHYARVVSDLPRPPIIIGHSFGGLVTELLLDRGLGACGVALSPAPIKGVMRLPLPQLRAAFPVLGNPANRGKTVELTPKQFHYAFTNTMDDDDSEEAYGRYEIPGPGRPLFEAGLANFNPHATTKANLHNDDRPPLLVVGNTADHTVPA